MKQTATTALRLSQRLVNTIGDIVTSEHPDLIASPFTLSGVVRPSKSPSTSNTDCRVFRNFIHISSLKSCIPFMNASGADGELAQVNTLYRVRDMCRLHNFKPVSYKLVGEQFQKAKAALQEARKFEELLETDKWPSEMETTKANLICTTKFDIAVLTNKGNDRAILDVILELYRRTCPQIASFKEEKYKAKYVTTPAPSPAINSTAATQASGPNTSTAADHTEDNGALGGTADE